MAVKYFIRTVKGLVAFFLAVTLAVVAGCTDQSKDQPTMEKTTLPAPTVDKSGKPMQGPPPGMPR